MPLTSLTVLTLLMSVIEAEQSRRGQQVATARLLLKQNFSDLISDVDEPSNVTQQSNSDTAWSENLLSALVSGLASKSDTELRSLHYHVALSGAKVLDRSFAQLRGRTWREELSNE